MGNSNTASENNNEEDLKNFIGATYVYQRGVNTENLHDLIRQGLNQLLMQTIKDEEYQQIQLIQGSIFKKKCKTLPIGHHSFCRISLEVKGAIFTLQLEYLTRSRLRVYMSQNLPQYEGAQEIPNVVLKFSRLTEIIQQSIDFLNQTDYDYLRHNCNDYTNSLRQ